MTDKEDAKRRVREILADAIPESARTAAAGGSGSITINGAVTVIVEAGLRGNSKIVVSGRGRGSSPKLFVHGARVRAALDRLPPYRRPGQGRE